MLTCILSCASIDRLWNPVGIKEKTLSLMTQQGCRKSTAGYIPALLAPMGPWVEVSGRSWRLLQVHALEIRVHPGDQQKRWR